MLVRKFDHEKDFDQIESWYIERKMPTVPRDLFPKTGFIVDGAAAGFLYVADGGLGIIEGCISAKNISHALRTEALETLILDIFDEAKRVGLKKIMMLTQIQSIYDLCLKVGSTDIGYYRVLTKDA